MAEINVECINPFLMAATSIMKDACQMDMKIGTAIVIIAFLIYLYKMFGKD